MQVFGVRFKCSELFGVAPGIDRKWFELGWCGEGQSSCAHGDTGVGG